MAFILFLITKNFLNQLYMIKVQKKINKKKK